MARDVLAEAILEREPDDRVRVLDPDGDVVAPALERLPLALEELRAEHGDDALLDYE